MYNYLIIFCFTLFYTSVFYPRNFYRRLDYFTRQNKGPTSTKLYRAIIIFTLLSTNTLTKQSDKSVYFDE